MTDHVLYYPRLSLPDEPWANRMLLYFDQIGVIAPEPGRTMQDVFDSRTRDLIAAGVMVPLYPAEYCDDRDESDERFITEAAREARRWQRSRPLRSKEAFDKIHAGKFAFSFVFHEIIRMGLAVDDGNGWYNLPRPFSLRLMTYFAVKIALHPRQRMGLLTDERSGWKVFDARGPSPIVERQMRAVGALLPEPHDVGVAELIDFRERHGIELARFRDYISALLVDTSSTLAEGAAFEARLKDGREMRDALVERMLRRDWKVMQSQLTFTALPVIASLAEGAHWSAAAALSCLAIRQWAHRAEFQFDRERDVESPLAYAAMAETQFRRSRRLGL